MNRKNFASLRDTLIKLYHDNASIRRIMEDADLKTENIVFDSNIKNVWHAALREADKIGGIEALLRVIAKEYGDNPAFQAAWRDYNHYLSNKSDHTNNADPLQSTIERSSEKKLQPNWVVILILILVVSAGTYWGIFHSANNRAKIENTPVISSSQDLEEQPIPTRLSTELPSSVISPEATAEVESVHTDVLTTTEQVIIPTPVFASTTPTRPIPTIAVRRAGGTRKISLTPIPSIEQ